MVEQFICLLHIAVIRSLNCAQDLFEEWRAGADAGFWRGGVLHELLMKRGARASRAKIFVVRIPIFPQIVHVREPGIGN